MKIAIVVSRFNENITKKLLTGAKSRLLELDVLEENISIAEVPGAVELPIMAQHFALTKKFQAIICLGAVIQGETDHYHFVAEQASQGCQIVALKHHIPVIFGVLTTHNLEQALARVGGDRGHAGRECADAAMHMIQLLNKKDCSMETVN